VCKFCLVLFLLCEMLVMRRNTKIKVNLRGLETLQFITSRARLVHMRPEVSLRIAQRRFAAAHYVGRVGGYYHFLLHSSGRVTNKHLVATTKHVLSAAAHFPPWHIVARGDVMRDQNTFSVRRGELVLRSHEKERMCSNWRKGFHASRDAPNFHSKRRSVKIEAISYLYLVGGWRLFNLRASSRAGIDDERAACIVSVGWSAFHHVVEQSDNLRGERGFNHFLEDIVSYRFLSARCSKKCYVAHVLQIIMCRKWDHFTENNPESIFFGIKTKLMFFHF
jgi:hypothetical protein